MRSVDCEPMYKGSPDFVTDTVVKHAALENLKVFVKDIKDLMNEERFIDDIIKTLGPDSKIISDEVKQCIGSKMMPKSSQAILPDNIIQVKHLYECLVKVLNRADLKNMDKAKS